MALSSSNYFSKSIQGIPGAGADVDVGALANATSQSAIIAAYTSDIGFLEGYKEG